MKKIVDILRKLGIFRSGSFSAKYKSGKDIPFELLMDDVFDSKKDLTRKKDLKTVKKIFENEKSSSEKKNTTKIRKILFWLMVCFVLIILFSNLTMGLSVSFFVTLITWILFFIFLKKFAFSGFYSFGMVAIVFIFTLFFTILIFPSSDLGESSAGLGVESKREEVAFEKKVLKINSAEGDLLGSIGLEKKKDKKKKQDYIMATYKFLLKTELPFNSKCEGLPVKFDGCNEIYEYGGRLVRSDKEEKKGNGVLGAVFCNKDDLGDPFETINQKHTIEACGIDFKKGRGVYGLKTDTFSSVFSLKFDSYQEILDADKFEIYSFAEFWEEVDGEVEQYRSNVDLAVEKTQPIQSYKLIISE